MIVRDDSEATMASVTVSDDEQQQLARCLVQKDKENRLRIEKFLEDYTALIPSRYTYADIKKITTGFKDKLGQGAYGTVFKGKLSNDIVVAVKILNISTKENEEEFINEVATLARIHHVNVVYLVGYCAEGVKRALVYEFMPNGSLDKFLKSAAAGGTDRSLSWETLHNIALGIAKGIEYLHQEGEDFRILIKEERDAETARKLAIVGLLCIKRHPISHPTMIFVVQMLEGNKELSVPLNPFTSTASKLLEAKLVPFSLSLDLSHALPLHGRGYIFGSGSQRSLGKPPLI
ncbi:hypothetical protein TIFTF001_021906 [Ficus carica]|uniref:Protein kinase domain-containing protein n=1 Tax=Ficus carica TaxID=3494 RepID=A0AA88AVA2_FICCA|nr:hypothetical protein TIFTF001_021906 [Ficus carica]